MQNVLSGSSIMLFTLLFAVLILFGIPKLFEVLMARIFEMRKNLFEEKNPDRVVVKMFGITTHLRRAYYEVQASDNTKYYLKVHPGKLEFHMGTAGKDIHTLLVDSKKLYDSLKAWKAWNPTNNGLKVKTSTHERVPTFNLGMEDENFPQFNRDYFKVSQVELLKALENASKL